MYILSSIILDSVRIDNILIVINNLFEFLISIYVLLTIVMHFNIFILLL